MLIPNLKFQRQQRQFEQQQRLQCESRAGGHEFTVFTILLGL